MTVTNQIKKSDCIKEEESKLYDNIRKFKTLTPGDKDYALTLKAINNNQYLLEIVNENIKYLKIFFIKTIRLKKT